MSLAYKFNIFTGTFDLVDISSGSTTFVDNELVGIGDGNTTSYTLDFTPVASSVRISVGGLRQTLNTDYTITGTAIEFTFKVPDGQAIIADYRV